MSRSAIWTPLSASTCGRAETHPAPAGADDDLCHPRPGRGHEHGRQDRGDVLRRAVSVRLTGPDLQLAGQPVRRPLHRQPEHELHQLRLPGGKRTADVGSEGGRREAPVDGKAAPTPGCCPETPTSWCWGFAPNTCTITAVRTADTLWEGSVYAIEPLGPKTIVHLKVGDDLMQVIGPAFRPAAGRCRHNTSDWIWRVHTCSTARRGP